MADAIYWLDSSESPGCATVKVFYKEPSRLDSMAHKLTGHRIWRIEIEEILKPSTVSKLKLYPGRRMTVSGKHLGFRKDRILPDLAKLMGRDDN